MAKAAIRPAPHDDDLRLTGMSPATTSRLKVLLILASVAAAVAVLTDLTIRISDSTDLIPVARVVAASVACR